MKLRKVRNSLEHRGYFTPTSGIGGENLSAVFSAAALLWSDVQETTKSVGSPGQWEGRERDSHPNYKFYLKSQI